tara:strand:- start:30 stop:341 length:312 start_codon:yes stop_codon:yes gene_type:complete
MENIVYKIFEQDYRDECDNLASILEEHDYKYYSSNNVKQLTQILNYYGISKHKMCKDALIKKIIWFETDVFNEQIVNKRKHLWACMKEINDDLHLSKYLIMEI